MDKEQLEHLKKRFDKQMKKQRYDNSGRKHEFIAIAEELFPTVEKQRQRIDALETANDLLHDETLEQQEEIERYEKLLSVENKLLRKLDTEKRTLKGDIMNFNKEINSLREALNEKDIEKIKNTTITEMAQQLEEGLIHKCCLDEEMSVLEFIKNYLNA